MGVLVELRPVPRRAATIIRDSGLGDEEIADHLSERLAAPIISPVLVELWRYGKVKEPPAPILELLAQLRPRSAPPALPRVAGVRR